MNGRVPVLVGPGVPGPAGIAYLPRFWLRSCLREAGLLDAEAFGADAPFDDLLNDLSDGFDCSTLTHGLPTYVEFESRFLRAIGSPTIERIRRYNDAIATAQCDEAEAAAFRARTGLEDTDERNVRRLVDLDAWTHLHAVATTRPGRRIVPAVSSTCTGPLGATHLPRMWAKALLTATGCIPPGYNSGTGGGDTFTAARLGLDMRACMSKISTDLPTYLHFETWVRSVGRHVDAATVARHNADAAERDKPPALAEDVRRLTGVTDASINRTIILNDLEDWSALHASIVEGFRAGSTVDASRR